MAEIGRICIVVAFVVVVYLTVASALGALRRQPDLLASARNGVYVTTILVSLAWAVLLYSFAAHDFSILYVARYNSRSTELAYSLSGAYAGQEGSLLMWAWGIAVTMLMVTVQYRKSQKALLPWVTATMGCVAAFFLGLLTLHSDPFIRVASLPADGQGLNPLLENVGMLFHPPALYIGYIAFTVPFAFAIAALITGQLDGRWADITRNWALFAWAFLGLGNLLGAQWAYVELGWGGYWGWDPVENSSLMPWLTGTAFLHSAIIQRRKSAFKIWSIVLIAGTFVLTIFGTFLTRSDLLASVHSFGESNVGPIFVAMILGVVGSFAALLWIRRAKLRSETELESIVSRESSFLLNNLLLVGAAFAVLWGTIFPIISEAARGTKVTMNASFFNQVAGPILLAIVLLMGICPLLGWQNSAHARRLRDLRVLIAIAIFSGLAVYLAGFKQIHVAIAAASCGFTGASILLELCRGIQAYVKGGANPLLAPIKMIWINRQRYGGYLVHLGIVLIAIGVVFSFSDKIEQEITLSAGQDATVGDYRLIYNGISIAQEARKDTVVADIDLYSGNQQLGKLTPSKEFYRAFSNPNTEVAIYSTPWKDLYIILDGWTNDSADLHLMINPLVSWIWIGGYVLLLGAGLAFWPQKKLSAKIS